MLEFIVLTESGQMETEQQSLYRNFLAIGLAKVGKIDLALDQIDLILLTNLTTDEASVDGKLFLNTVSKI